MLISGGALLACCPVGGLVLCDLAVCCQILRFRWQRLFRNGILYHQDDRRISAVRLAYDPITEWARHPDTLWEAETNA